MLIPSSHDLACLVEPLAIHLDPTKPSEDMDYTFSLRRTRRLRPANAGIEIVLGERCPSGTVFGLSLARRESSATRKLAPNKARVVAMGRLSVRGARLHQADCAPLPVCYWDMSGIDKNGRSEVDDLKSRFTRYTRNLLHKGRSSRWTTESLDPNPRSNTSST